MGFQVIQNIIRAVSNGHVDANSHGTFCVVLSSSWFTGWRAMGRGSSAQASALNLGASMLS
jgi:hypothetical protein